MTVSAAISYQIKTTLGGHRLRVLLEFTPLAKQICKLYLPIWIPGSYMRRDFAKHISDIHIKSSGKTIDWEFISPSEWQFVAPDDGAKVVVSYEVYAHEESVRGNFIDDERGFINPCATCIAVEGYENAPQSLSVSCDPSRKGWHVVAEAISQNDAWHFKDYDELIDTPIMLARNMVEADFEAGGVVHHVAITGHQASFDMLRLSTDVARICRFAVSQFGALPPIRSYRFMLHMTENGFGGLEHRASTLLIASRHALPRARQTSKSAAYIQLLGLFSHEYFHTWNVKDLKPLDYQTYNLRAEHPTNMLWLFEGFTAYFDNLILVQSGVISEEEYLKLLARDMTSYWQRRGRFKQTLAQSSFEAWTKLYQAGEDSINSSTNYYIHGALFAFCLDAYLRAHCLSLAESLRQLWLAYRETEIGLDEARFSAFICEQLPVEQHDDFKHFLHQGLHTTAPLPLKWAAATLGLDFVAAPPTDAQENNERNSSECGFRWQAGRFCVSQLNVESKAAMAGLAVGDEIIAINALRATHERLQQELLQASAGEEVCLSVFRDGVLKHFQFTLSASERSQIQLKIDLSAIAPARSRARRWLQPHLKDFS